MAKIKIKTSKEQNEDKDTAPKTVADSQPEPNAKVEAPEVEGEQVEPVETIEEEDGGHTALIQQLEVAQAEAGQNLEGWQRTAAELANFKRRQEEQRKLLRDRIKGEVMEGVISALDDMDLAFQNVPEELEGQLLGWVEGFRLVQRKLNKILDDQNVMPINTDGEFDPTVHEAVSYEPHEDFSESQIIAEVRKGYQIGNRVIRPAMVRVAQ
jgi:molecular chaperone GrpE